MTHYRYFVKLYCEEPLVYRVWEDLLNQSRVVSIIIGYREVEVSATSFQDAYLKALK